MLSRINFASFRSLNVSAPIYASAPNVKNFIDGQFVDSKTKKWIDLTNPVNFSNLSLK